MKKISIAIPTRNEEDNIQPLVECIRTIFKEKTKKIRKDKKYLTNKGVGANDF